MYNPFYYYYLLTIFRSPEAAGTTFAVLLPSRVSAFEKGKTKSIRLLRAEIARKIFVIFCKRNASNVLFLSPESVQLNTSEMKRRISDVTPSGLLPDLYPEFLYLGKSLHSTFCDLSGSSMDSTLVNSKRGEMHHLIDDFEYSFQLISNLLTENPFDFVIFFNGRNPDQAGIREATERNGVAWLSLEHGSSPGTNFHLEDFQTQDRISFQARVNECARYFGKYEREEITNWSHSWLASQRFNGAQNNFLRTGASVWDDENSQIPLYVPIYTSSLDETLSETQWSSIDYMILVSRTIDVSELIRGQGLEPIVIIHPNALNKSWKDLSYLISNLESSNISYLLPWVQESPYRYLDLATFVVTWRSTIGVEASAKGIPTFLLADSIFDLTADVKLLNFPLASSELRTWDVDVFGALLYIYYFFNNGYEVSPAVSTVFKSGALTRIESLVPLGSPWISLRSRLVRIYLVFTFNRSTPMTNLAILTLFFKRATAIRLLEKKLRHLMSEVKFR